MLLVNWIPFTKYDSLTVDRGLIIEDNVEASQRQRLFIDASTSSGGKMTIPFYWPTNYFSLVKDNTDDFGTLSVRQLNPLMHVSGSSQMVTIYIRAKMVNVKLHTSTSQTFASQPGMSVQADESPDDKLSSKASAIASAAASLTPVLGGYATATAAAAGSAAAILRAMGMSHPRSKEMIHKMENRPLGNVANYNTPSNALSLGLDEHNEVTIDPVVANLVEDEMALPYILKKEAFIGQYDWSLTNAEGTILASHRVHPFQYIYNASLSETHCSPMAYVSRLFQFWTGTIRFRFQIVCSKWHRGRLRIIHEPMYTSTVPDSAWLTNMQSIIDITEERDFTIDVKYVQGHLWCQTGSIKSCPPSISKLGDGTSYTPADMIDANGLLKVVVMNRLVIPDDTVVAPAHINVFVSAGDDFELNVPLDNLADSSIAPPTSGGTQNLTRGMREIVIAGYNSTTAPYAETNGLYTPQVTVNTTPTNTHLLPWVTTSPSQVAFGSMSLTNTSGTSANVTLVFGGASQTKPIAAGATTAFTIANAPSVPLYNGTGLPVTLSHDAGSPIVYRIDAATLPVKPGFKYQSSIDPSYSYIRRDGQQDAVSYPTPPPTYPVQFNLVGAPTIYWKVGGSTGLYTTLNNGNRVFCLTKGPVQVNSGIYGPQFYGRNDATISSWGVDISSGNTYIQNNFQLFANFAASTTVNGIVYDVIFTVPALVTQADEQDDAVADPTTPPTQASFHDSSIPTNHALTFFGEKILHLRQILGRPQYHTSYALTGGTTLTRNNVLETDIPEYPGVGGLVATNTPFMFMVACYNGWRGTMRSKYVFNGAPGSMPSFARLERRQAGFSGRSQTSAPFDVTTSVGLTSLINSTSSMWTGAVITNPQLANELNAEFPYYYRYRFRSARPAQFGGSASSTNSHVLNVDFIGATTGGAYMDRYFQPGEDFTLLNWVSTPILR
jgi:hypothetical protein